jgi:hypothetical protein
LEIGKRVVGPIAIAYGRLPLKFNRTTSCSILLYSCLFLFRSSSAFFSLGISALLACTAIIIGVTLASPEWLLVGFAFIVQSASAVVVLRP